MLKDFSYLPKSDRVIFIILILSVVGLLAFLYLAGGNDNSRDIAAVDSLAHDATVPKNDTLQIPQAAKGGELFAFDPNTADSTQLVRLGLNKWQVKNIYKYRAAGGVYRQPSDFARLWGLTKKQFERLRPYIRISDDYKPAADFYGHTGWKEQSALPPSQQPDGRERPVYQRPPKLEEGQTINLNTADTTQLKMVPGIGSYFARQIVNYRKRLGGFCHTGQLMEIRQFPDEALRFFRVSASDVHKININKATLSELQAHPYINFYQAKAILQYRRLRGPIKSLSQLRASKDFTEESVSRLEPYVEY